MLARDSLHLYYDLLTEFLFTGSAGVGFTPHVITVKAGEVSACPLYIYLYSP